MPIAQYSLQRLLLTTVDLPAAHATCPAFDGNSNRFFCTSATEGRTNQELTPADGQAFETQVSEIGQFEHQVILGENL